MLQVIEEFQQSGMNPKRVVITAKMSVKDPYKAAKKRPEEAPEGEQKRDEGMRDAMPSKSKAAPKKVE